MKSTYEKPSERKKRIKTENLKRIKKQQKLSCEVVKELREVFQKHNLI